MKIKISRLAAFKIQKLLDYLEEEWSVQSRHKFIEKMTTRFNNLKQQPRSFPQSITRPELRKMVITRQTTALYKIMDDTIFIVTIFDIRQDPEKIEIEIKKHFG